MARNSDKKMAKLTDAVLKNPNDSKAWGNLAAANYEAAVAFRDLLVATGRMQLAA